MQTFFFKSIILFFCRILFKKYRIHRNVSNGSNSSKYHKFSSIIHRSDLSENTLMFNVEGALLKSSSPFPYFMLVAFEGGSAFRALMLLFAYPFVCLLNEEMGLNLMVMISFFGLKKDTFRVGRAVLPKYFLEDVGLESFQVMKKGGKKVGVSNFPRVMVESFLRDYLDVDFVVGREIRVFCGYFVGIMEKKKQVLVYDDIIGEERMHFDVIGITSYNKSIDHQVFSHCKELYVVTESERKHWNILPREKLSKPLIFHDGRLAFRPTPAATLAMFIWLPFGFLLSIFRALVALNLPFKISIPILAYSGLHLRVTNPKNPKKNLSKSSEGYLYVCNHRTLLDPLYLSFSLHKKFTAVTYSLSRVSEILAPIKTVRLTRNRDKDAQMMETLLNQGDLVVCPEGTTCREPYLLRFSPLFAELSDNIIPVAINSQVGMFYGTTAGGLKCLDPLFFLMNPFPSYEVKLQEMVAGSTECGRAGEISKFDVANQVQKRLGDALGFECTNLTRRDKYLILAGNEGIVKSSNSK